MTKSGHVLSSESIYCLCGLLIVNCVHSSDTIQRAVLEGVRGERVVGAVPQASAADLHALIAELADVDQNNNLVSGDHEVLHTGSYHLADAVQRIKIKKDEMAISRCLKDVAWTGF